MSERDNDTRLALLEVLVQDFKQHQQEDREDMKMIHEQLGAIRAKLSNGISESVSVLSKSHKDILTTQATQGVYLKIGAAVGGAALVSVIGVIVKLVFGGA